MSKRDSGAPIVIAHRGASGYAPEHTLTAYLVAIQQGADYVEPDLVMTRDGVLIARHENEIGGTTDVASHPEFADRRTTRTIDGRHVEGWFTEDFTLAEIRTLRARERIPELRFDNTLLDGRFGIPTFDEIVALVRSTEQQRGGRRIGIYPETKHPSHFAGLGLAMEKPLIAILEHHGYADEAAPVFIQSFETGNLKALSALTRLPLVQLIDADGAPYDLVLAGDSRTVEDLIAPEGLAEIATYASAIGVNKALVIPRAADGTLARQTDLVARAHEHGLLVHAWTFRAENYFLPTHFRSAGGPAQRGEVVAEMLTYLQAGIDGFFTDHPDLGVRARNAFVGRPG